MNITTKPLGIIFAISSLALSAFAQETATTPTAAKETTEAVAQINKECPITGKAIDPKCTTEYEGKTYGFCSGDCREKFQEERANSLYQKIGGKAAIDAAVDRFYVKVLADDRVNHFFEDVNMKKQHNKQKAFISAALGGPEPWKGKDMRKAHTNMEIEESHFNVIAEHLQSTLEELKVPKDLVSQVMAVVGTTKDAIVNKTKS